ncbi:hypothetical protein EDB19DRAFT_589849 [Suillus lakei]|nr:hypothetical protein EDB19DRAFT_589849 [Suillus lakei]
MRDIVLHLFFFLALLFCAPVRAKYRNVTVDNTDPSIYYVGNWSQCTASKASSYGGTRNCTAQDGANATFTFSGVAIYYIAPLFSGVQLTTALALDSESRVLVNLTMAEGLTPEWAVRWGKSGLNNGQHTLVDYGPSSDTTNPSGTWGEVDAFIYTVVEQDHNIAAIVGGTVAGVVALLLAGVCYLFGQHLADRLRDFAFGVFGWLLFKGRRFAFISDLPSETKITLFLTLTPGLTGSQAGSRGDGKKMGLCWKVLNIGGGKRQEVVHLPSRYVMISSWLSSSAHFIQRSLG